jgi:hypothetical protein
MRVSYVVQFSLKDNLYSDRWNYTFSDVDYHASLPIVLKGQLLHKVACHRLSRSILPGEVFQKTLLFGSVLLSEVPLTNQ